MGEAEPYIIAFDDAKSRILRAVLLSSSSAPYPSIS